VTFFDFLRLRHCGGIRPRGIWFLYPTISAMSVWIAYRFGALQMKIISQYRELARSV
jgi:hypothetical protein